MANPKAAVRVVGEVKTEMFTLVQDKQGRVYKFVPDAKPPHSRHHILYTKNPKVGDEEIPLQNNNGGGQVNGASPGLILAAVYNDLRSSKNIDHQITYHIERALSRMKALDMIDVVTPPSKGS